MKARASRHGELSSPPAGKTVRSPVWATLAVLALGSGLGHHAFADCQEAAQDLMQALWERDLGAVRNVYTVLEGEVGCGDFVSQAKQAISELHTRAAEERMSDGATLESQRDLLEGALAYARSWRPLAYLGDAAHQNREFDRATNLYEESLMAINNEHETPTPPPKPVIERIYQRAAESRLLAESFVPGRTNRSGKPDGLAATSIRGFVPERVPIPITFLTNSASLTGDGQRYAELLAEILREERPDRIVLSAHTDERGDETHNFDLSRRRGKAVAQFLRQQGFTQPIDVRAMGESEPFPVSDDDIYGPEERWQLDRRVQLVR